MKWFLLILAIAVSLLAAYVWWQSDSEENGGFADVQFLEPEEYLETSGGMHFLIDAAGKTNFDILVLPKVPDSLESSTDTNSGGFAGSEACAECHASYFESFVHTSHYKTSAEAGKSTILGSFAPGKNKLKTASPNLTVEMLAKDDRFLQRVLIGDGQATTGGAISIRTEFPFDLVTGSGKIGQTYCYWEGDHLYQLHASYLTGPDAWINSPGYIDGTASFGRPVIGRCLECHATYFQNVKGTRNQYSRDNYVLGVGCEKCHGPGREHIEHHRKFPDDDAYKIVNTANLSAKLAINNCQLCHGGTPIEIKQPAFSYQPGEDLSDYYVFDETNKSPEGLHSNAQFPRLRLSKCFQQTDGMTCVNCHDPHQFERADMKLFSDRCLKCHPPNQCGKFELMGEQLRENCIDCHMPRRDIHEIQEESSGDSIPQMRDHLIKVWNLKIVKLLNEKGIKPDSSK